MASDSTEKATSVLRERRNKLERLREHGTDPFFQDFRPQQEIGRLVERYGQLSGEALEELADVFSIAGRLTGKRDFGRVVFLDLVDRTGRIQCFVQHGALSKNEQAVFRHLDVGDHVGMHGRLFRTRTGELTLNVSEFKILSKALRPLPEKWHGIRDVEARYRQRYLDLLMNPHVLETFRTRARIIRCIRDFFDTRGFQEVETPMMQPLAGGADARPFVTHHNALNRDLYLRVAPELYLKRLVIGGVERVYEINKNFRNEGISTQHNPEFTMLEFYQAYATFEDFMITTEELLETILSDLERGHHISYQGKKIDFTRPWKRVRFLQSLEEIGGVPTECLHDMERLHRFAHDKGLKLDGRKTPGKIVAKIFDLLVEPHLQNPTFVTHYPVEISPLSRRNPSEPQLVDRFELFVAGQEIANAFSELTDPDDQRQRFMEQMALRDAGDDEAHPLDEDYLRALEHGMPPTAGEGVGIDRVVMLLTDSPSIRDVILFPQLRQEKLQGPVTDG